jgi:hypothetical protein
MPAYAEPVIPAFPAGYDPVTADMSNWVRAPFGGYSAGVVFRATLTTGQPFASGATIVQFNGILEDNWSGWNTANFWYLAPWTGLYAVDVTVAIAAKALFLEASILVSGATLIELGGLETPASFTGGQSGAAYVPLVGGVDYIQCEAKCSSTATAASGSAGVLSSIEIAFVSQ